jgi:hypothetical protein
MTPDLFGTEQTRRRAEGIAQPVAGIIIKDDRSAMSTLEDIEVFDDDLVFAAVVLEIGDVRGKGGRFDRLDAARRAFPRVRFHAQFLWR